MAQSRMKILVVDVGGTNIKLPREGRVAIKIPSGPSMTAKRMVRLVKQAVRGWPYTAVSIGYPGPVVHGRPIANPMNLGDGWVGFDFQRAFGRPVRLINDAAMQALGSYRGGRMLFLGFGTGLGTAMIIDGTVEPMELAHLPYMKGRTYEEYVGKRGLKRLGKRKWRKHALDVIVRLQTALEADDVVVGGGNARLLKQLPPGVRLGSNEHALLGGLRLWRGAHPPARRHR